LKLINILNAVFFYGLSCKHFKQKFTL